MMQFDLASKIDHTNLKPTAQKSDIFSLCEEAAEYGFSSVCVASRWVATAHKELASTDVKVCSVVGFPHGNSSTHAKVSETMQALRDGAVEIDMVMSVGDMKAGNFEGVHNDILEVSKVVKQHAGCLKVILETGYLDDDEVVKACIIAVKAGVDFVKTSTGFGPSGADPETVALMRKTVGEQVGVKAAGGIKTLADAQKMLNAGASRLGCSSSVDLINELSR